MLIDLHVPTTSDDDALTQKLDAARRAGLNGVMLCWRGPCGDSLPEASPDLQLFHALEMSTPQGTLIVIPSAAEPELLKRSWGQANDAGTSLEELSAFCAQRGWARVLAQPFSGNAALTVHPPLSAVDAVEITTGEESLLARDLAVEMALAHGRPLVAGSGGVLNHIGRFATFIRSNARGQIALIDALCAGRAWVVQTGPHELPVPPEEEGPPASRGRRRRRRRSKPRKD